MDFPIDELMNQEACTEWVLKYMYPEGLKCPQCQAPVSQAREFRRTSRSQLMVYRCTCGRAYNLYTGTVFEHHQLTPVQVVLLMRGVTKGETTASLSRELKVNYNTVLVLRHEMQANAEWEQPQSPLRDVETESDEVFQNAGEKRQTAS